MKSIVVGLGETGGPLRRVLNCDGYDPDKGILNSLDTYDILNICIPYSDRFDGIVKTYQYRFQPIVTVIHSTVPIGTTSKIPDAVHSPILGKHGNMEESIRSFDKWVGGAMARMVSDYFESQGLYCVTVETSEETEALKLMCLAKYGISIAFAQYQQEVCDKLGFSYEDVVKWDINYNKNVAGYLNRPIMFSPGAKIGGHCVVQNMPHLDKDFPSPLIKEVLKFK